jgi:hypothetical protein
MTRSWHPESTKNSSSHIPERIVTRIAKHVVKARGNAARKVVHVQPEPDLAQHDGLLIGDGWMRNQGVQLL